MLLVEVGLKDEKEYWELVKIVRGREIHPKRRKGEVQMSAQILMTEKQMEEAQRRGYDCRILKDYSKLPDPKNEVSKVNRFEAELRGLREKKAKDH